MRSNIMAKKRFTFAMAKEEIKDLKEQLAAANVKLNDNVVTKEELKWLKLYKFGFFAGLIYLILNLIF